MDKFQPQSGDLHVSVGHESGDFSVRGIVVALISLVVAGVMTFIAAFGLLKIFEWAEVKYIDKPATAAEQQLDQERGQRAEREGAKPTPDWYNREIDARAMEKIFAAPRLQDDDAADMRLFHSSEETWLDSTGKNADGGVHIPLSQAMDLVLKQGLPSVNGTFTPQPALGPLEAVSDFSKRRVQEAGGQVQQPSNQKKK